MQSESIESDSILKDLLKRVENIEKQMKKDKEEQIMKLNAELKYLKFCCSLSHSHEYKSERLTNEHVSKILNN